MREWSAGRGVRRGAGWLSALVLLTHCGGGTEAGGEGAVEAASVRAAVEDCQTVTRYENHVVHAWGDAYVVAAQPDASFGREDRVLVDGDPRMEGYLAFSVTPHDLQEATVSRAVLRLTAFDSSSDGPALYRAANGWGLETVTWNTRPALVGGPLADLGAVANGEVDFDVTSVVRGAGEYSFGLVPTGGNGVDFYSRDRNSLFQAPHLLLTLARTYCERRGTGGDARWARQRGGDAFEEGQALAVDPSGGYVIAGRYAGGSGNFGGETFTGGHQLVLAKYGPDGAHQWSRAHVLASAGSGLLVEDLTLTPLGNILVVGHYQGAPDLGGGPLPSTGGYDRSGAFIAKFSPDGSFVWARGFVPRVATPGGAPLVHAWGRAVATDANGSLYVSGSFLGRLDLGGGELDAGSLDHSGLFVAKYSWEGVHQWSTAVPAGMTGTDVSELESTAGLVFVSGYAGRGSPLGTEASYTPFVAAFSAAAGNMRWTRPFNGAEGAVTGLAVMPEDTLAFSGYFNGTVTFDGTQYTSVDPPSGYYHMDMMLGTLSVTNGEGWFRHFASEGSEYSARLEADAAGNLYATGFSSGDLELGGGVLGHPTLQATFVAKYNRAGGHTWSRLLDPALVLWGLGASPSGEAVVGGRFIQPATVDGTRYTPRNDDLLFLKLGP